MDVFSESELKKITEGHVFYQYQEEDVYINNLLAFIKSGLENKEQILIIESMRNLPKVREKVDAEVDKDQHSSIRLVNNYEYYLSNGDFHTQTILTYFQSDIAAIKKSNSNIRTWAHVEWTSSEPDIELLKEFESFADNFVSKESMLSVCAYSSSQLTSYLTNALEELHTYVMTDDTFTESKLYIK